MYSATRLPITLALVIVVPALAAVTMAGGGRGGTSSAAGGGSTLEVDINDPQCGMVGEPFCQIQDAIDAAQPGDTIEVDDGVYMPISIPAGLDDLTIEADDDDDPIIEGDGTGTAVEVNAIGFELSGFEIRNADGGVVINIGANGCKVEDCEVHTISFTGIRVESNGNEIEGNECFSCGVVGGPAGGIEILLGTNNTVEGNECRDNPGNGSFGIIVTNANDNSICDNDCVNNGAAGILLVSSEDNEVEGNCCESNGGAGIVLDRDSFNNDVEENGVEDNLFDGISLGGDMNTICRNESEGNIMDGIFAFAGSANNIEDNESEDNGGFGINDVTNGGGGDFGTDNFYDDNECDDNDAGDSFPEDICD